VTAAFCLSILRQPQELLPAARSSFVVTVIFPQSQAHSLEGRHLPPVNLGGAGLLTFSFPNLVPAGMVFVGMALVLSMLC